MIREAAFWVACVITFGSLVVNNTPLLPTCLGKEKMGHNHNKLCSCFKECSDRSRIIQVFVCFKAFLQNLCVRHTDTENQMERKHNELWKCCYRRCFLVFCHRSVFVSKLLWETFGKTLELATSTTSFWECSDSRTGDFSVTTAHLCSGHIWKDTRTRRDTGTTSLWECSDRRSRQDTLEEVRTLHMTLKRATSTTSLCR